MLTETLKNQLHSVIEEIDDVKTLKAVHQILKQSMGNRSDKEPHFTRVQRLELDKQWKEVLAGKGKSYSWEEVKMMVRKKKP